MTQPEPGLPPDTPPPLSDQPVFAATLSQNRSLSPAGLKLLLTLVGVVGLMVSVPFLLLGAWPVAGFFGLDVLLIYFAFRINNARARAFEQVIVSRLELLIRKVSWRGRASEWRFNPKWVRIEHQRHEEFGSERLALVCGPQSIVVAACLGREERDEFAGALMKALAEAKRG